MSKYDIIIIGGGPGGYVAAIRAAQLGAKVALIEKDKLGGTCLNRGCIPTKALLACTTLYDKIHRAESFGLTTKKVTIDWQRVVERKDKIVEKLVKGVELLIRKNNIEFIHGEAKVLEPGKVEVQIADSGKQIVESRKLILATGSSPASIPGITSDDPFTYSPISPITNIVGGGVIGLHLAMIYSSMGSAVTIYEALPEILSGVDDEIVALIKRILARRKVQILTNGRFEAGKASGKTFVCVGRVPNTKGLEALNLKLEVNERMETSIPGVFAIGDLISKKLFAHVASEQGIIAAENALGGNRTFNYDCVPYGIYTSPEIGAVGLTEKEARVKYQNIKIGKFPFGALGIAQAMGEIEGFIKVVTDENGALLGVHIIGPEATTLIGSATLALKNGLTVDQLAGTIQAHPTFPEGLHEAALTALKQSLHSL
jgi:dihydrolipoamide dehydrogenase